MQTNMAAFEVKKQQHEKCSIAQKISIEQLSIITQVQSNYCRTSHTSAIMLRKCYFLLRRNYKNAIEHFCCRNHKISMELLSKSQNFSRTSVESQLNCCKNACAIQQARVFARARARARVKMRSNCCRTSPQCNRTAVEIAKLQSNCCRIRKTCN